MAQLNNNKKISYVHIESYVWYLYYDVQRTYAGSKCGRTNFASANLHLSSARGWTRGRIISSWWSSFVLQQYCIENFYNLHFHSKRVSLPSTLSTIYTNKLYVFEQHCSWIVWLKRQFFFVWLTHCVRKWQPSRLNQCISYFFLARSIFDGNTIYVR